MKQRIAIILFANLFGCLHGFGEPGDIYPIYESNSPAPWNFPVVWPRGPQKKELPSKFEWAPLSRIFFPPKQGESAPLPPAPEQLESPETVELPFPQTPQAPTIGKAPEYGWGNIWPRVKKHPKQNPAFLEKIGTEPTEPSSYLQMSLPSPSTATPARVSGLWAWQRLHNPTWRYQGPFEGAF